MNFLVGYIVGYCLGLLALAAYWRWKSRRDANEFARAWVELAPFREAMFRHASPRVVPLDHPNQKQYS